jgi:hypothetical protein
VKTFARIVVSCLKWSKATITSETISAMSGTPIWSGFGSPTVGSA